MLWKTSLLTPSKLAGFALGVSLLPMPAAFAQHSMQYSNSSTTKIQAQGIKTAVVAATDTGGDQDIALRALKAATIALGRTPDLKCCSCRVI